MPPFEIHPASYRDPSGFIFSSNGIFFRQVNRSYAAEYNWMVQSGLYGKLTKKGLLLPHQELDEPVAIPNTWFKTLQPVQIKHLSYATEWCFEQLKDAALLVIQLNLLAMKSGMMLKDATPYNIQFIEGRPVWIDTLSFERYDESKPWIAYRQFCETFLFPLYVAHYTPLETHQILLAWKEGIPADKTWALLPFSSRSNPGVWMYIYLQQNTFVKNSERRPSFSKTKMTQLLQHLEYSIKSRKRKNIKSNWSGYYDTATKGSNYLIQKEKVFRHLLNKLEPCPVIDVGANTGFFSLILAEQGFDVVAIDDDSESIAGLYEASKNSNYKNLLPLVVDIANPTPATGLGNREQSSFLERTTGKLVVALALVHHLAIGKNIPLSLLARYFSQCGHTLMIEWIPRSDEKVKQLLAQRKDIFENYREDIFEESFSRFFVIYEKIKIEESDRIIYLMKKR